MFGKPFSTSPGVGLWIDRCGVWASGLCVLHCVLTPILISSSAVFAHLIPGEERVHRQLAILVAALGAAAVANGIRKHRRYRVLFLVLTGLALIWTAAWFGERLPTHAAEVGTTLLGSSFMVAGHRLNHTFCGTCACRGSD
jgi:hypothetical protein